MEWSKKKKKQKKPKKTKECRAGAEVVLDLVISLSLSLSLQPSAPGRASSFYSSGRGVVVMGGIRPEQEGKAKACVPGLSRRKPRASGRLELPQNLPLALALATASPPAFTHSPHSTHPTRPLRDQKRPQIPSEFSPVRPRDSVTRRAMLPSRQTGHARAARMPQ